MLGQGDDEPDRGVLAALTPAERRVAELVAAGSTNRAAADQLFVSVRAIEVHLTNSYRKLGIRSRTELAGLLARTDPRDEPSSDRTSPPKRMAHSPSGT